MNKNILRSLIGAVALSAAMVGTASADQMWDFGSLDSGHQNTSLGAQWTFHESGQWLTATAVVPSWSMSACTSTKSAPCLFAKYTSGDPNETGLGLEPNVDNEIYHPNGIALEASTQITSIEIGSVQNHESYELLGCSASFGSCVDIKNGIGAAGSVVTFNVAVDNYASYIVTVPCANNSTTCDGTGHTNQFNNIVLIDATTVTVPEPATLALFGAGLLGCAIFVGRRRRSSQTRA
jgi:hypothetical protein